MTTRNNGIGHNSLIVFSTRNNANNNNYSSEYMFFSFVSGFASALSLAAVYYYLTIYKTGNSACPTTAGIDTNHDNNNKKSTSTENEERNEVDGNMGASSSSRCSTTVKNGKISARTSRWILSIDDITNRIGELPSIRKRRSHWPWDSMNRSSSLRSSNGSSITNDSSNTDSNINNKVQHLSEKQQNSINYSTNSYRCRDSLDGDVNESCCNNTDETNEQEQQLKEEANKNEFSKANFCIGNIFGIDVGGTLAKLAYFERRLESNDDGTIHINNNNNNNNQESFTSSSNFVRGHNVIRQRFGRVATAPTGIFREHTTNKSNEFRTSINARDSNHRRQHYDDDKDTSSTSPMLLTTPKTTETTTTRNDFTFRMSISDQSASQLRRRSLQQQQQHSTTTTMNKIGRRTRSMSSSPSTSNSMWGSLPNKKILDNIHSHKEDYETLQLNRPLSIDDDDETDHDLTSSKNNFPLASERDFEKFRNWSPSRRRSRSENSIESNSILFDSMSPKGSSIHVPSLNNSPIHTIGSTTTDPMTKTNNNSYHGIRKEELIPPLPFPLKDRRTRSMHDLNRQHHQIHTTNINNNNNTNYNNVDDRDVALDQFYTFARRLHSYKEAFTDETLSFYSTELGGEFHFLCFETRRMPNAMDLIRENQLHINIRTMGGTGGGAHRFAEQFDKELGITMKKHDELDSLVAGMQFVLRTVVGECYTYRPCHTNKKTGTTSTTTTSKTTTTTSPNNMTSSSTQSDTQQHSIVQEEAATKKTTTTTTNKTTTTRIESTTNASTTRSADVPVVVEDVQNEDDSVDDDELVTTLGEEAEEEQDVDSIKQEERSSTNAGDDWWWSRKVRRDVSMSSSTTSRTYPYLVVTIGTGVSILRVDGPRQHERVSGSTIGGGTYLGLIRLLTDVDNFDDIMHLAEQGDPSKCDMMIGDIYGNNNEALEKLGLPANLVASSFGKLVTKEDPTTDIKQEDLARSLLLMITINIGQVAYLNAQLYNTTCIYFVGNFLRENKLSQKRLAYAINYWSNGKMEALFLHHEGYLGSLGAFLLTRENFGSIPANDTNNNNNNDNNKKVSDNKQPNNNNKNNSC